MKNLLLLTLFFCLSIASVFSQKTEKYDYHPPLKIPLILASNFGELRPNHFHMGLDFKTNNRIGYNLYSIEDGFVSRIKVSPYGYGKVVYIDHPNGVTSVYAHCSEFKGQLDSIVRATQEKEENFVVEIFPRKDEIKVKRGQVIAISGNTGGSTAPHLHFELRDTKTEHALNPLNYGFEMADHKAPEIRGIKLYALTKDGYRYPGKAVHRKVVKGQYGYYIGADEVTLPASYCSKTGGIGFAADVIDRFDGASNRCGLFGSYLIVNGDTLFGQKIDRVPFESTRYVNSHKDYEDYQTLKKKLHKSFKTTENDLPIYTTEGNGVLNAKPGDVYDVVYIAFDANGNTSELKFKLKISEGDISDIDEIPVGKNALYPQETHGFKSENTEIEFGLATVYEPCTFDHSNAEHQILKGATPVNRGYKIKKKVANPDEKYYLEMKTGKNKTKALGLEVDREWLVANVKYFGTYKVRRDTIPPSITPIKLTGSKLTWKIQDAHSGLEDYDIYIDGKWHLLEYEYKGGSIATFTKPTGLKGSKEVVVRVIDGCGNEKEWTRKITF